MEELQGARDVDGSYMDFTNWSVSIWAKPSEEAERKLTFITSSWLFEKVLVLVKATKWNWNSGTPMLCLVPMLFVLLNYHDWKYSLYPSIQFNHIAHIYVLLAILSESVHENPHFYCRFLLLQQDWRQAQGTNASLYFKRIWFFWFLICFWCWQWLSSTALCHEPTQELLY